MSRPTDDQFVELVRQNLRTLRRARPFFTATGVLCVVVAIGGICILLNMEEVVDALDLSVGVVAGLVFGLSAATGINLILCAFLPDRKGRLLVRYYDESVTLRVLAPPGGLPES